MTFTEFLKLVSVLKMLYGTAFAEKFFTDNVGMYYDLDSASLLKRVDDQRGRLPTGDS